MKKDYDEFEYDHKPQHCDRPDFPPFCPKDIPEHKRKPIPPMPPVPSVVTGMDLYEAMNNLSDRVNVCIDTYNSVMAENYKTLHNMQRAAEENGAYYDPHSVWVEEGYYADESSTYRIIHKSCVDRHGEPIRMQLHLAYGNTTNSMIEQPIFASSKVAYADKMVVAIPKTEKGWYGKAIYHGCPIASTDEPELYTVGFTKSGAMRVYNNGVSVDQMLRDTVVDAMGCSGVLIQNGQVTDEAYRKNIPNANEQVSRVVMGQVGETREVVILTVGNENDVNRKGLTSLACANILKQYGCDIAVELCEGVGSGAVDKGSLMYEPDGDIEPSAYAYWFISRKCFYKNDYERELAELVQNYGACIWQGFLNKKNIAKVKAELDAEIERAKGEEARLDTKIDDETERAKAEEARLDQKIDDETARATEAERVLQENIDKEQARAEAEEARLDKKIDDETARAEAEEDRLDKKIDAETERAEAAEQKLSEDLDAEVHRATNAEAILHQEILTEQGERVAADTVLQTNINNEASTRASEDQKLQTNIDTEASTRVSEDLKLKTSIEEETSRAKSAEADLNTKIETETNTRISEDERLESLIDAEATRAKNSEAVLQGNIDAEAERAKSAEGQLQKNIDAETNRAKGAEEKLASDLDAEVHNRETADDNLHTEIETVNGKVVALAERVTECESDIVNLQTITTNLQNQMSSLDKTVAGMLETVNNLEVTMNTLKQSVLNMQNTVNAISDEIDDIKKRLDGHDTDIANIEVDIEHIVDGTTELPYVKKAGDTMTGELAMSGNKITGVADGSDTNDAVNYGQLFSLQSAITEERNRATEAEESIKDSYVKKAGDTMSGSLAMSDNKITGVADGSDTNDAVNYGQLSALQSAITAEANRAEGVESDIKNNYVKKSGDTMSGDLNMSNNNVTGIQNLTPNIGLYGNYAINQNFLYTTILPIPNPFTVDTVNTTYETFTFTILGNIILFTFEGINLSPSTNGYITIYISDQLFGAPVNYEPLLKYVPYNEAIGESIFLCDVTANSNIVNLIIPKFTTSSGPDAPLDKLVIPVLVHS